jgi:ribose 5-phosphate isomerase B
MNKNIIIGSDHAGFELKGKIISYLKDLGYSVDDLGTNSEGSVDYPVYGKKVADKVAKTKGIGVLVCGSGIGVSMTANKVKGVRAALCYDKYTAKSAREHNNANVLCMGERTDSAKNYKMIVNTFLNTKFSKEERHHRRVKEMDVL